MMDKCANCGEHFKKMETLYHHDKQIVCSPDCAYEYGERRGADAERKRLYDKAFEIMDSKGKGYNKDAYLTRGELFELFMKGGL